MSIRKLRAGRVPTVTSNQYVGEKGTIFWDEAAGILRLSDGHTAGGSLIRNPAVAITSNVTPSDPFEGLLWYNLTTKELWAYSQGAFRGTINPATSTELGGIKAGPGVVIASDGTLSLDSTNIPFSFGDFYASTLANGDAALNSTHLNQNIDIISNGTGQVNVVGTFHVHATDGTVIDSLNTEPIFKVSGDGQIRMLVPIQDSTNGALEIVGNTSGVSFSPNQTGVIIHATGNTSLVSRYYFDGVGNYSLLAGRRYNGTQPNPTRVLAGEIMLRIAGQGATQATTEPATFQTFGPCQIDWVATEDQKPNNQGGEIRIRATPNGSNAFTGTVQVAAFNATTGVTAIQFNGPLTGNVTGNISGNAGTVTNGVYTSGSYSDPSWLTLSKSKVGLGNVENTALSTSTHYIGTTLITYNRISASQTLTGVSIDGNAGTVTNGVYTSSSYSDPSWLTITKSKVGLGSVENTALSTWPGTTNITTVGTLSSVTSTGAIRYDVTQNNATVTQLTSKGTAVTCNGLHGQITTSNSSIAKGAAVTFTVNNSSVTALTDVPIVAFQSGATVDSYAVSVTRVQVGSFNITINNNGTGPLTDTIIINFAIIKVS